MVQKKKITSKKKKRWYTVLAPKSFKSIELSEIAAFEPKNLLGRTLSINMMQITGSPKDQQKRLVIKISDIKGEKAITEVHKYFLLESYIQRSFRRYKERLLSVLKIKTKDNRLVKIKLVDLIPKRLQRRVRSTLINSLEKSAVEKLSVLDCDGIFKQLSQHSALAIDLKKELRKIYPVDKILVWKIAVLPQPKNI